MEGLFTSLLCLPITEIGPTYAQACRPAAEAFVLQSNMKPQLKQIDIKAGRVAKAHVNKFCLVALLTAVQASTKKELAYTIKFKGPLRAMTIAATAPGARVTLTLVEF